MSISGDHAPARPGRAGGRSPAASCCGVLDPARGRGPMPSVFKRLFLPGFAFKAVVIGGGYATGRELAEYFLPSGPWGGLLGMLLAMALWGVICAVTFLFARASGA